MKLIGIGASTFYASNMARWSDIKTVVVKDPNNLPYSIDFDVDKGEMIIDLNPPTEEWKHLWLKREPLYDPKLTPFGRPREELA